MGKLLIPLLFFGTIVMIVVMGKTGATLKTVETPKGILDLEFAYNKTKVDFILNAWSPNVMANNIDKATINTYLDFIFLAFYSTFLFFACKKMAKINGGKIGLLIAKGALLAGFLDIVENVGMLVSLSNVVSNTVAFFTCFFSVSKWALAAAAVLYLVFGLIVVIKKRKLSLLFS